MFEVRKMILSLAMNFHTSIEYLENLTVIEINELMSDAIEMSKERANGE